MAERLTVSPSEEDEGSRIDAFLAGCGLELSRQSVQRLIRDGRVCAAGQVVTKPSRRVALGETIEIDLPEPVPLDLQPEDIPLDILFEDEHMAAIDKPAGMCVHPTASRRTGTLVNALLHCLEPLSSIGGVLRPGIVHRLDQGTSGVIVIAKNDTAHANLARQFHDRQTEKHYIAIVDPAPGWDSHEVDEPIGRDPKHRKRMAVIPNGRSSQTSFRRLARHENLALIAAEPHSGRTHQIRVHLRHCGCPVANDELYRAHRYSGPLQAKISTYTGLLLHAGSLSLSHPASSEKMRFEAPIPKEIETIIQWIETLAKKRPSS